MLQRFWPVSYTQKVFALAPIAYWPQGEPSGSVAGDESGNGRDGAYTGVDLGQVGTGDGRTSPLFDGTNDYCNIYSTSFANAFNNQEGTAVIWARMSSTSVWTDATVRRGMLLRADNSNRVRLTRNTVNNQIDIGYTAGGTDKVVTTSIGAATGTNWFHMAITWSKSADQVKAYINGAQVGSTLTGLGVWAGALSSTSTVVGAGDTTPTGVWNGNLAHAAVWARVLSAAEIAQLAVVP